MRGLVLVSAGLDVPINRRIDMNIDILREPIDDLETFGKRGSSLQFEG